MTLFDLNVRGNTQTKIETYLEHWKINSCSFSIHRYNNARLLYSHLLVITIDILNVTMETLGDGDYNVGKVFVK